MKTRYLQWDYLLSTVLTWIPAYAIAAEIMYAWNHRAECFTGRQVIIGVGILLGTFILEFAAVWWNIEVAGYYNRLKERQRQQQQSSPPPPSSANDQSPGVGGRWPSSLNYLIVKHPHHHNRS